MDSCRYQARQRRFTTVVLVSASSAKSGRVFCLPCCAPNPSIYPSPDPIQSLSLGVCSLTYSCHSRLSPLAPADNIDYLPIPQPRSIPRSTSNNHPRAQTPRLCCLRRVHASHIFHPASLEGSTPPCISAPAYLLSKICLGTYVPYYFAFSGPV